MKYVKLIVALAVCSLADQLTIAQAAPVDQATPHAYDNKEKFCDGAKKKMARLNSLTEDNVKKIEELKQNINELEAKKNIIAGIQKIKDEYLDALNIVNNENDIEETTRAIKKQSIDQFKNLLNKTLMLDAISLMVKTNFQELINKENESQSKSLTGHDFVQDFCDPSTNKTPKALAESFCLNYGNKSFVQNNFGLKLQADNIRETINHYMEALNKIPKKTSVVVDVSNILASIPKAIRPAEILEILKSQSPTMTQALVGAKSSDEVMSCLEGSNETCEKILKIENRENLQNLIKLEAVAAKHDINEKMTTLNQNIDLKNTSDLKKIFHTFDNPLEARVKGNQESLQKQLENVQNYSRGLIKDNESLFQTKYPDSIASNNGFKLIGLKDEEYKGFVDQCTIPPEVKADDLKKKVAGCKAIIEKLSSRADKSKKEMENEINTQKTKLAELLKDSGKLNKIEKIKQFVLQRYIRSCPQAKTDALSSNISEIKCLNQGTPLEEELDAIGSLSTDLSNAIGRLQHGNRLSAQKGELGLFSKDELKVYINYCQNISQDDEVIKESCQQANQDYAKIAHLKESKEWDEYNQKYWVEYDAKKGYIAHVKKSNLRILGEGLSQSMSNIYPIWFGNMQLDSQIQMMTSQAMYQKQMMYMNSFDSPWMQQTYFQGNYLPTMPAAQTGPGFNFGP